MIERVRERKSQYREDIETISSATGKMDQQIKMDGNEKERRIEGSETRKKQSDQK